MQRSILLAALGALCPLASGQMNETVKVSSLGPSDNDGYGLSLSLDGGLALVGAQFYAGGGTAYLYDSATGQELAQLTASDREHGDRFGCALGLEGTTALIGAYFDEHAAVKSGSAYLVDVTTGQELHKLVASDAAFFDVFGSTVAIGGSHALVGAGLDDDMGADSGSVYLFDVSTGQQVRKLNPSDGAAGDYFGVSIAVQGSGPPGRFGWG